MLFKRLPLLILFSMFSLISQSALVGCEQEAKPEKAPDDGFRVVAYIDTNLLAQMRNVTPEMLKMAEQVDPDLVDYVKAVVERGFDASHLGDVTDVIFINSVNFNTEGEVVPDDGFFDTVKTVRDAAKGKPVRFYVNLIGPDATTRSDDWDTQMVSKAKQHNKAFDSGKLEQNILAFLKENGFDGVFFDYEFPTTFSAKKRFSEFLVSLRETLGNDYTIGMAVGAWCADFSKEAIDAVDRVEVMAYDIWDEKGYHAPFALLQTEAQRMLELGYPKEKLDLGIPFYARPTTKEGIWYNYVMFYDKLDENGLYREARTGLVFSFNTPRVVYDKTAWAIDNGFGGVMVWNYACDVPADNEASLFRAIARARNDKKN